MSAAVLSVKTGEALKEKLRHYTEMHNENLSAAAEKLPLIAFTAVERVGVSVEDTDSQRTEESVAEALAPREIKTLHRPLKKKK